jgi:dipeptidyl aminopeptidase/acylaminoacyl peptidase
MFLTTSKLACYRGFFRLTIVTACLGVAGAEAQPINHKHPFTVQDSIEISYIIDPVASTIIEIRDTQPVGSPIFSPDRKHFLLITQRGILKDNHLEATIWLFDQATVRDYVREKSPTKPAPRAIARFSAPGNTPAISDVRWLDSSQVAFLAKDRSPYQQLFLARIDGGSPRAITPNKEYVSAYDISGNVVAYTSLIPPEPAKGSEDDVVDVTGKNIYSLLFSRPRAIEDVDEEQLQTYPSTLHVLRNGKELPVTFRSGEGRLRLFIPTLSLSPDGRWLITVAPVLRIPSGWEAYEPNSKWDVLRLRPDNTYAVADENPWKASQYVLIDVQSGDVSPLVDAPAGRGLIFLAPTKAFWLEDSRRAILTNSFLPVNKDLDQKERTTSPAVVVANIRDHTLRPVCFLQQTLPPSGRLNVENILWNRSSHQLTIIYTGTSGSKPPKIEHYTLDPDDSWEQTVSSKEGLSDEVSFSVEQDLDHPPVLRGRAASHAEPVLIWDPNPQLNEVVLGKVTPYSWNDKFGNKRRGLLALPPDYDPHTRYALVIQPYGYDPDRFFADGAFTTGYGGRALAAKGIVVLQMETLMTHYRLPDEGSFQVEGFRSAINQLAEDGFIDRGHVGILGFSYTCFHVLQAITHQPDLFEAALITDGINTSYMQYLLATDHGVVQEQFEQTIGAKPFGRGLLQWYGSSPGFNFDMTRTPLLISALERGQLLEQWENYSCLRKLNKPVDMVWLRKENAPHILVQPAQRFLSQQMTVDWFCFWLKGLEEPDPAKSAQYRRWRELRRLRDEDRSSSSVARN